MCLKMESRVHPALLRRKRIRAERTAVSLAYVFGIELPLPVVELQ